MKYKINWKKIKDNYKGFEKLAVKYVQMEYDSNFTPTGDTRDGNKDAVSEKDIYTIILGYQASPNASEEWWMEAKYSESKDIIPRYRLDATLVSAILKGNVGRIIFVTNMNIQSQTITDIRQAIIGTTVCKEVNFCTRHILEYWLYQNPDILSEFFGDYKNEDIDLDDLILIDKLKYYSTLQINYTFKENLRMLDLDQIYCANFTVFSKSIQTLKLHSDYSLRGIKILTPHDVVLKNGVNNLQFRFMLKANYGYKSVKKQNEHEFLPEPIFRLGTLQIFSESNVVVNKPLFANLKISSQKNMEKEIFKFFYNAEKISGPSLFYLYGQSGVGKSQVLNNYISAKRNSPFSDFLCEMTGGYQQDLKNLIDCINYIYFPFLPSDGITEEYLNHIENNNYFPPFYKEIIRFRDEEKQISQIMMKYISEDLVLFPHRFCVNQRWIIIDNIHKMTTTLINVLYKIVIELSMIKAPFRLIFSGQWIQHTDIYTKLRATISIREENLKLIPEDCLGLISNQIADINIEDYLKSNQLFSNVIELFLFTIYLREHNESIKDFNTFQIMYHLFFCQEIMDIYLKQLFDRAISNDIDAFQLCNQVYWNIFGISRTDSEAERKLLCYQIVKFDVTAQKIIPYHDLYAKCYRKNYICNQFLNVSLIQLLESGNYPDIKSIADKLHVEYKKKNYIFVYYTLEPLFKDDSSFYRNLMDDTTYFILFHDFAHACAFCSIDYSGGKLFMQIYNETKLLYNPAPQIQLIHNSALWELANSTFEALNYTQALKLCNELLEDTKRLVEYGIISGATTTEDTVRYHNANVIKSMIKSEMQEEDNEIFFKDSENKMINYKKEGRLWSFRVRYSLTLMQQNPQKALRILEKCRQYYVKLGDETEKYYLWSCFYISYIKLIIEKETLILHQAETEAFSILDKMRNCFFNDYRKMLYGIVLYLYYCNRKDEADVYLLKDCYVLREKRPRLKGFEHLIFSLRYIMEKENVNALNELKKAYAIFEHIPSYSKIIKHNINLIETNSLKEDIRIKYYLGGVMEENTYYLDIRGCW